MKKIIICFLVGTMIVLSATPGYCGPLRKLGRGICNIITCPMELFNRSSKSKEALAPDEHFMAGLMQGGCMLGFRLGAGVWEVLTFPFPIPPDYEPLLNDPEFFITWPAKGGQEETKPAASAKK